MPNISWQEIPNKIKTGEEFVHSSARGSYFGKSTYKISCKGKVVAVIYKGELTEFNQEPSEDKATQRLKAIISRAFGLLPETGIL